jgi:hypothetical protein
MLLKKKKKKTQPGVDAANASAKPAVDAAKKAEKDKVSRPPPSALGPAPAVSAA